MAIFGFLSTITRWWIPDLQAAIRPDEDFNVVDPKIFHSPIGYEGEWVYLAVAFGFFLFMGIVYSIYTKIKAAQMGKNVQKYKVKKDQTKMLALQMSEDGSEALQDLAKRSGKSTDDLLTDNRNFEKAVNQVIAKNPADPILAMVQSIREQADFVYSNHKVAFVCTQMLEVGQELRVFVTHKGKDHSFLARVLRVTQSELWLKPPKAKGKVINLTVFKRFEIRLYRPQDGEYHFFVDLVRQIKRPVNALVLSHALQVTRLNHRQHERIAVELEKKIAYLIPKVDAQFTFGETEAIQNTVTIMDISAGGLRFVTEGLPDGVEVETPVVTLLPEVGIRKKIRSKIVRIDHKDGDKLYFVHLMFGSLTERDRHLLEKFIHETKLGKKPVKKAAGIPSRVKDALAGIGPTPGLEGAAAEAAVSGPEAAEPIELEAAPDAGLDLDLGNDQDLDKEMNLDLDSEPGEPTKGKGKAKTDELDFNEEG